MDAIVSGPTEHCHAPTPDLAPVLELKNKIKIRAADTEELPSTILHSTMRSFPLDAAGQLPQSESLLRSIRRQRPAAPMNADNKLPDQLKQTDRGENFVLHEDDKLIIFTTATNLSVLKTCKHWFVDGTFKVKKNNFQQPNKYIGYRCVQTISTKCLLYTDCSSHKLSHSFMVYSSGKKPRIMTIFFNELWMKTISILKQY